MISDDPIINSIERTGYPPWMRPDYPDDDEPMEEGDDTFYGNESESF